ncbi:hypothetical protein [Deinococcus sonorensis]|uniref:Uncharacterized protein n=2 Tax=Deinococcus sonorensis TaxID=309891 RepID=A0AAU7UAI0_9DEIO
MTDPRTHQEQDADAQRHPEGNAPDLIEDPQLGLPVPDGVPEADREVQDEAAEQA